MNEGSAKVVNWDIKPIQDEVLKVFKTFASICSKHGLRYYAAYGTALGAIRHAGFIPWDDDFDVVMPRPDFMQFAKIVESELHPPLHFRRGGIGFPSPIYFAHIINESAGLTEALSRQSGLTLEIGPYLDIFVLDGLPDDLRLISTWYKCRKLARMCQMFRYPETIGHRHGLDSVRAFAGRLFGACINHRYRLTCNNDDMMNVLDEVCCKWPYEDAKCVAEFMFFRNKASRIIPKSLIGEGRMVPFCDTEICVPSGVETILAQYYGDYMTYPPEKDRKPPHIMKLLYEGHV